MVEDAASTQMKQTEELKAALPRPGMWPRFSTADDTACKRTYSTHSFHYSVERHSCKFCYSHAVWGLRRPIDFTYHVRILCSWCCPIFRTCVCVCVCVSVWCVKLLSIYLSIYLSTMLLPRRYKTIRYDTIEQFDLDSKAEYSALSSTRSQKKKLKQTTPVPLWYSTGWDPWRKSGWLVIRTLWVSDRSLYSMRSLILSQCRDLRMGVIWKYLGS